MNELAIKIHEIAVSKGFWDKERNTGELLMLVVSELSEALEATRLNKYAYSSDKPLLLKKLTENNSIFIELFESTIKDTFEDEIADAIIRLLDMCAAFNIDIEKHIKLKMEYNKTRERLHGKKY